jgi:transcriptional regulator with XRE-family HTH domain/tetratricopeptide (TPR) repeat protein
MVSNEHEQALMSDYLRTHAEMSRALAARDIGTVFGLLNRRGGTSLRALGAAVGMTASRVQEIINGKRHVTSIDVYERIADALEIPGHQLGLAPRPWESSEPVLITSNANRVPAQPDSILTAGLPWHWEAAPTVDAIYNLTRSDLVLDRRQAARSLAITFGLPLIDPVQRWISGPVTALPRARLETGRITPEDVDRLEKAARVFRDWDDSIGGGLARKAVVGQLNEVAELARERHQPEISARLYRVMAELAKIAATMSWDSGMQAAAQKYSVLALQAAKPTGDRALGASILASMARQLLYLDKPADALELIRLAQDGSRHHATPRVRSMLHTREAWCYANLGRTESFRRATEMAEDELNRARPHEDRDPYWITYFDAAELAGVTGGRLLSLAHRDLRQVTAAVEHITSALELRNPSSLRSRALDQAGLAQLHFLAGDIGQAVSVGTQAVETARRTKSDRVRLQLRELYAASTAYRHGQEVAELRERMREPVAS